MPEMPEVETIKRGLTELVIGHTIKKVTSYDKKFSFSKKELSNLIGAKFINIRRFGKLLVFDLNNNFSILIHLKMTGQLVFHGFKNGLENFGGGHPTDSLICNLPDKSTRVEFDLDCGKLFFNDQRKFGIVHIIPTIEVEKQKFIVRLGPEPPKKPDLFLKRITKHKSITIKAGLLDQSIVSGIGNIYCDESLWMSKINPKQKISNLTDQQLIELYNNADKVMQLSIRLGGSTSRNYVNAKGEKGKYLEFAHVYGLEGEPCSRCGTAISKTKVAGRGTHFCPKCQPLTM
ncbi:MAG: DNA-formamidopyrimidine glycosylase [Candidatus Ancillula sp.]|jgi:formamidopyrimidine-DNA glycosylase|nr:DNA-formamidopyrimidine glycosylase [Candidatus Ancillula sp.]